MEGVGATVAPELPTRANPSPIPLPQGEGERLVSNDQNIGPRFAAPPSIVMIVPVVYADRSDARNATMWPISSGTPARP